VSGGARVDVPAGLAATVLSVAAAEGQRCEEGDVIAVLEAMKLEIEVTAPVSGTVVSVPAQPGTLVGESDVLAVVEEDAG
jgi:biotin carboxyl carrier protein